MLDVQREGAVTEKTCVLYPTRCLSDMTMSVPTLSNLIKRTKETRDRLSCK